MARLLNGKASQELTRIEDAPWYPIQIITDPYTSWLVLTLDSQRNLNTSPFDCTGLPAPHQALIYLRSPLKPLLLFKLECIGHFDFEHCLTVWLMIQLWLLTRRHIHRPVRRKMDSNIFKPRGPGKAEFPAPCTSKAGTRHCAEDLEQTGEWTWLNYLELLVARAYHLRQIRRCAPLIIYIYIFAKGMYIYIYIMRDALRGYPRQHTSE